MMKDHYENYLRAVPVFSACSQKELSNIASVIERLDVRAGDVLVHEGARASEFFIILSGEAQVTRQGQFLATLSPGRHFGELALLDPAPRNATVAMTTDGEVLVLTQREFFSLLHDVPGLVRQLLTGLAQRVHTLEPTPAHERARTDAGTSS
jgi:cAMP-dependent protein kinase regulator